MKITGMILKSSDFTTSTLMYAFMVVTMPVSAYLVVSMYYRRMDFLFSLIINGFMLLATISLLFTTVPPSLVNQVSSDSNKPIFGLLARVPSHTVRFKFKLLSYSEEIASSKVGFSMGPFGIISVANTIGVRLVI